MSFSAKYTKKTGNKIKLVQKQILDQILADQLFDVELLTIHQRNTNLKKAKKIIKLLILNLVRSIHNESQLIVSMDNNLLQKQNINRRMYKLIIDKLQRMDYITISKGYFNSEDGKGKRTRITANKIKDLIIKATTEYTEDVSVYLVSAKRVKVAETAKAKLTFKAVDSDTTWSCFRDTATIQKWLAEYGIKELKNKKIKLKLNGSRIINIEL